eukprot:Selendium_serpulae@DN6293_c0_g1_i3.p1
MPSRSGGRPPGPLKGDRSPKLNNTYSQSTPVAAVYSYAPGYSSATTRTTPGVRLATAQAAPVSYTYPGATYVVPSAPIQSSLLPRQQIQGAHDNLRKVLDDNEALEVRLERLQREVTELRSHNENLTSKVNSLTQENTDLRDELSYYERARNHPLVGEAVRSLTRNANAPVEAPPPVKHGWCWS